MNTTTEQEAVTLPPDRKRPPVSSFFRERVSEIIPSATYRGLSPVNIALLAALNAALYRHTGNNDISIGLVGDERLVSLRTTVAPEESVHEFMRQLSISLDQASTSDAQSPYRIAFQFSG